MFFNRSTVSRFAVAALCVGGLVHCGSEGTTLSQETESDSALTQTSVVGTWLSNNDDFNPFFIKGPLVLKADGSFSASSAITRKPYPRPAERTGSVTGKYSVSGKSISFSYNGVSRVLGFETGVTAAAHGPDVGGEGSGLPAPRRYLLVTPFPRDPNAVDSFHSQ